jgi:hypothetical protein
MASPNFRTGVEEAEKAAARTTFLRVGFLSIEDGASANVRMLTDYDKLITVLQHSNAPTRDMPQNHKGKWPQIMPAVCRGDKAFKDMYDDCFLDIMFEKTGDERHYKPKVRSWGLGVMRKKLMENGRLVGFEDETIDIKIGEETKTIPKVVTINYAYGNFWGGFGALRDVHGTWLATDLLIKRKGAGTDSDYSIAAYPEVGLDGRKDPASGQAFDPRKWDHAKKYVEAIGLNLADFENIPEEERTATVIYQALMTLVGERASDEFYARFYDTRVAQPESSVVPTEADGHDKPEASELDEAELNALADRVQGHPTEDGLQTVGFG